MNRRQKLGAVTLMGFDTVTVGSGLRLTAVGADGTALESKTLAWASSDESLAVVADGWVDALAEGSVTITATTADGASASQTLTVRPKPPVETTRQAGAVLR